MDVEDLCTEIGLVDVAASCEMSGTTGYRSASKPESDMINSELTCGVESQVHTHKISNTITAIANNNGATSTQDLFIGCIEERLNNSQEKVDQGNQHRPNLEEHSLLNNSVGYSDNKTEDINIVVSSDKLVSAGHHSTTGHNENSACNCGNVGNYTQYNEDNDGQIKDLSQLTCTIQNMALETKMEKSSELKEQKLVNTDACADKDCEKPETVTGTNAMATEVKVTFYGTDEGNDGLSDSETAVARKARKLNPDDEIQDQKSNNSSMSDFVKIGKCSGSNSSSDLESLGDSEDSLIVGESQEVCDCDECLLGEEAPQKPLPTQSPMKKVIKHLLFDAGFVNVDIHMGRCVVSIVYKLCQ